MLRGLLFVTPVSEIRLRVGRPHARFLDENAAVELELRHNEFG